MKKVIPFFLPLLLAGSVTADKNRKPAEENTPTLHDGPYVIYRDNKVFVSYIRDNGGEKISSTDSMPDTEKEKLVLEVATDEPGKTFTVKLKSRIRNEKTEYRKVSKQLVISDIEGNFSAFRKMLQLGGVIDKDFNWTFGEGHLVLTGDFFDRGGQVTEVLWLVYALEEKAKAAGGYVHFILGNHEIMNMSGDKRYVHPKYIATAALLNHRYEELFSENAELGRWLRSKNIMERIGDILYTHGGISAALNRQELTLDEANVIARPFYPDSSYQYTDARVDTIFGDLGPFWYRGYYQGKPIATMAQVDSTLDKFRVRQIATGHTLVADTISTWFGGKVINTDVHHAKGHSEALLIEGGNYYRINTLGEKFLMMKKYW